MLIASSASSGVVVRPQLPVDETIGIARGVADALGYAQGPGARDGPASEAPERQDPVRGRAAEIAHALASGPPPG
jgi:hypothetical protein